MQAAISTPGSRRPVAPRRFGCDRRLHLRELGGKSSAIDRDDRTRHPSGTTSPRNELVLLVEGRYGFAVLRPQAFVKVDLTAIGPLLSLKAEPSMRVATCSGTRSRTLVAR
jgi:hypothetical protein